jgi:integrase
LKDGSRSLYLDIYRDGRREYEFLKLYIVPERTPIDKMQNKETLLQANTIKAQRIIDLNSSEHHLQNTRQKSKANFIDYCQTIAERKKAAAGGNERGTYLTYRALIYHLQQYGGNKITFLQATQDDFIKGFAEYLKTAVNKRDGGGIRQNSQRNYIKTLKAVFNAAIEDKIIVINPIGKKQIPARQDTEICFLTADEVRRLEQTDCQRPQVKAAFLFSVFTGLRYSDIKGLTWERLQTVNNELFMIYRQKKTDKQEYLPISERAAAYLPPRPDKAADSDFVFDIPNAGYTNVFLKIWTATAGITKRVTFHVGRHTNATLLLSNGVALETISELLGHSNIAVTQIYAKVMNVATRQAVNTLNAL